MMEMKKTLLAALTVFGCTTAAQAATPVNICVFDLLGKSGEMFDVMKSWELQAKQWGAQINLIARTDEANLDNDFKAGKCDGVVMTAMRARPYNKFAGSIDALGGVPDNEVAKRAISFALDQRNAAKMTTTLGTKKYEVAGIVPVGSAFVFVRDKSINTIEKAAGKKFAVLNYDDAQKNMVESIGAQAVMSDVSNFVSKFNNGAVDMVGSPAYAFKPLEIEKGIKANGGMFNFPVLHVTVDFVIHSDKFPAGFAQKSRDWFAGNLPAAFSKIKALEAGIPAKYKINLAADAKSDYQKKLRDARISMTKKGIYDKEMMAVLKRARCSVDKANFECSLKDE